MRSRFLSVALAAFLSACGGGGAATGPGDGAGETAVLAALVVDPPAGTLAAGSTLTLSASPTDALGNPLAGLPEPSWASSNPAVATVAGGVVTGVGAGSAAITATLAAGGVTRSATVQVTVTGSGGGVLVPAAVTVRGVHDGFSPASVTIAAGGTVTWVMDDEEHDITWDGAAPPAGDIPRLDEDERATRSFPTAGTYTYHCDHHDSRNESGTVVVRADGGAPPVFTAVSVSPTPVGVPIGSTVQLTATPRDQQGNPMAGLPAAGWQSSDPARATVSAAGVVSGVAAGPVTITASVTSGGVTRSGTASVSVGTTTQPPTATVSTVDRTFSPRTVTVGVGGTVTWQFNATHNVTFGGSAPAGGNIPNTSGGTVSRQFPAAGSFPYECSLHSGMTGTVLVQ